MLRKSVFSLILLAAALAPAGAFAYTSPGKATGYVNDFAHVLQDSTVKGLDAQLKSLEASSGAQVAVVTVDSLKGDTIENYAVKLFQEWGIGDEESDRGLLILVSTGDHEARIEVGYGLEGTVTDLQSGNIIRNVMIPAFKEGDYDAGVSGAVKAVSDIITDSPEASVWSSPPAKDNSTGLHMDWSIIVFIIFFMISAVAKALSRTKSWWLGGLIGAGIGAVIGLVWGFMPIGLVSIIILMLIGLIFDYIVSKHPPGSGGTSGGIWPFFIKGGHGGSDDNFFGGFGGGMSGGGGASGRW